MFKPAATAGEAKLDNGERANGAFVIGGHGSMIDDNDPIIGNQADSRPEVLYVHGLFMTGRDGWLFCRRLRHRGLICERFLYASRGEAPPVVAARLSKRLAANPELNLVGHSLGGVIAALAIAGTTDWRGRAVLLGPPLSGSDTARQAARLPGGEWLLGEGGRYLAGSVERTTGSRSVLIIAGTRNFGIGRLIGACAGPGDGQVRVLETRLPGATHARRHRGHVALLLDRRVAGLSADFLGSNRFPGDPAGVDRDSEFP